MEEASMEVRPLVVAAAAAVHGRFEFPQKKAGLKRQGENIYWSSSTALISVINFLGYNFISFCNADKINAMCIRVTDGNCFVAEGERFRGCDFTAGDIEDRNHHIGILFKSEFRQDISIVGEYL